MRIVVTGSDGMLGCDLTLRLRGRHSVIGVDIDDIDIVNKDVIDYLIGLKPDFIFHLAAYTNVDKAESERERAHNINVCGTENIVNACKRLNIPLVFISTDYVFDGKKETSYNVNDNPDPINFYGETKKGGEEIITTMLKRYFIVRSSWLFGRNGKNFVKTITSLAQSKENIQVVDDQCGSPTYTRDIVVSLEKFLSSEKFGIYHITNSGTCSWCDFAKKIVLLSGKKTAIIPIKSENLTRAAKRPRNSVLNNSLFEARFNYRMPTWEDALERYLSETDSDQ